MGVSDELLVVRVGGEGDFCIDELDSWRPHLGLPAFGGGRGGGCWTGGKEEMLACVPLQQYNHAIAYQIISLAS